MRILALDLGTTLGYCIDTLDNEVEYGNEFFKDFDTRFTSPGMRFFYFRNWLDKMYKNLFHAIYYEYVMAHTSVYAAHVYGGFLAILQDWCFIKDIPFEGVPVKTIKKHITGNGAANKERVIKAVEKLGYEPQDDNTADAIAIFEYAKNRKLK